MGLLITFVGLGDDGFKTVDLQLIGPSLVGCGVFFALLRILFCTVPVFFTNCFKCCRRKEDSEKLIDDENILEDDIRENLKTALKRNGMLKPMRQTVTESSKRPSEIFTGQAVSQQPLFISDDEEEEPRIFNFQSQAESAPEASNQNFDGNPLSYSFSSTFSLKHLDINVRPEIMKRGNISFNRNKF